MPKIQATCLLQDKTGYLWVGTKGGVCRYDGVSFKTYTSEDGSIENVNSIMQLSSKELILYTAKGIRIIVNDTMSRLYTDSKYNYYLGNACQLDDKIYLRAWFNDTKHYKSTTAAILLFDLKTKRFELIAQVPYGCDEIFPISPTKALVFSVDSSKKKSFYQVLTGGRLSIKYTLPFDYYLTGKRTAFANNLIIDKCGYTYKIMDTNGSIFFEKGIAIKEPLNSNFIFHANKTILYVNHKSELVKLRGSKKEVLFPVNIVWCGMQDKQNNIWLASEDGLYCLYNMSFKEYQWKLQPGKKDFIWSMVQSSDSVLWLNSYGLGLWKYTENTGSLKKIDDAHINKKVLDYLYFHPLTRNDTSFFPGACGYLIITKGKVISRFDNKSSNLFFYNDPVTQCVLSAAKDIRYINSNLNLKTYISESKLGINGSFVLSMCRDKYRRLWFVGGSVGCLNQNGTVQHFNINKAGGFVSVLCDHKGNLWLAGTDGLWYYNYKKFVKINHPSLRSIGALHEYKNKCLIISAISKIATLNLDSFYKGNQIINTYSANNGFNGVDWSQNSILEDLSGYVWISSLNCVVKFHPDSLQSNIVPQPYINAVQVSRDNVNWRTAMQDDQHFPYNNLRFSFAAISLNYAENLYYKYRLKGFSDWSYMTKETYVTYTNLPVGNSYTFEAMATLDGIHWSATVASTPIVVRPAWYQTMIFYITIGAFAILSTIVVTLLSVQRRKRKIETNRRLVSLQLQSIRNRMLPHLTNNVYTNIIQLIKKDQPSLAIEYTYILSRINNKILSLSEHKSQSLAEELKFVEEYLQLQKLLYKTKFDYELMIDSNIDTSAHVPILVLHTFAENAIKHGIVNKKGAGKIAIVATTNNVGLILSVEDDGIGRKNALKSVAQSNGQGLFILNELIKLFNRQNKKKITTEFVDLVDENGLATGTIAKITIPYHYKF